MKFVLKSNTGIWKLQVICMAKHSAHRNLLLQLLGFLSSHIKTNEQTVETGFSLLHDRLMIIFHQYTIKEFLNNFFNIQTEISLLCIKHCAVCHLPQISDVTFKDPGSCGVWEMHVWEWMTKTVCLQCPQCEISV